MNCSEQKEQLQVEVFNTSPVGQVFPSQTSSSSPQPTKAKVAANKSNVNSLFVILIFPC